MTRRRPNRRLSADEFEFAVRKLRLQERTVALARAVMVDGARVTDLAGAEGVTYQRISNTVRRIFETHLQAIGYPSDWQKVDVTVPPALAEQMTAMAVEAQEEYLRTKSTGKKCVV